MARLTRRYFTCSMTTINSKSTFRQVMDELRLFNHKASAKWLEKCLTSLRDDAKLQGHDDMADKITAILTNGE